MANRQAPLTADIQRTLRKISRDIARRTWKALIAQRARAQRVYDEQHGAHKAQGIGRDSLAALAHDYHINFEDTTGGTLDLSNVADALRRVLDSLSATSQTVADALHGYFLNTVVLYPGDTITGGCFAGGMADYEQDQCRLYLAAGRLTADADSTLSVGQGRHNVATDFRSIIAHEIGHLVMPMFEDLIREKFRIIYDSQPPEYWAQTVSTYASTDDHELFGESFAAWTHPDYRLGMLPAIIEDVMRGVDMMKFDWSRLRKIGPINNDNGGDDDNGHSDEYNDRNDQGDVTITTNTGLTFTSDMIEIILDEVGHADWVVLTGTVSPALRQAFADAGYSELVSAGAGTDTKMFSVSAKAAEDYSKAHSADLVAGISDTTRARLRGTIEDAVKEGWDRYELEEEIGNNFSFGEYRAGLIAKNELALAYGRGRYEAAQSAGAIGKKWLLSSDHDPKEDCFCSDAADAGIVPMDESFVDGDDDYWWAPSHVNCVLSGATFAPLGTLHQMVRAWYDGPSITIEAAASFKNAESFTRDSSFDSDLVNGHWNNTAQQIESFQNLNVANRAQSSMSVTSQNVRLTVGPEHPILTRRGFVKAKLLCEGDEVLYDTRVEASRTSEANLGKVPLIEDAFTACLPHLARDGSVPAAAHYFHGDEKFIDGKVEVVRPTRHLLPVFNASGVEQLGKCALVGTDMSSAHVAGCRACQFLLERVFTTASGSVGSSSESFTLGYGSFGVSTMMGRADGSARSVGGSGDGFALLSGHLAISGFVDSGKLASDSVPMCDTFPLGIEHFQVLIVTRLQESTYVGYCYDASTESGIYAANGLLVKNCQCDVSAQYGKDDDDSDDDDTDADKMAKRAQIFDETMDWLNELTANQWVLEKFDQNEITDDDYNRNQVDELVDEDEAYAPLDDAEVEADLIATNLANECLQMADRHDHIGQRITGDALRQTGLACTIRGNDVLRSKAHQLAHDQHMQAVAHYKGEVDNTDAADAHQAAADQHAKIVAMIGPLNKADVSQEARDDHGRWTAEEDAGAAANLKALLEQKGGFTYRPSAGSPTSGYALSVSNANEKIFDHSPSEAEIQQYLDAHEKVFDDPHAYIGAWLDVDSGKVYLDCSIVEPDKDTAIALGKQHGQEAIYDIANQQTVVIKDAADRRKADQADFSKKRDGERNRRADRKSAQASADETLEKYNEGQARDDHGRWTAEGSESATGTDSKSVPDRRGVSGSAIGVAAPRRADFGDGEKPLEGLPLTAKIPGVGTVEVGPYGPAREAARQYMAAAGLPYNPPTQYVKVDPANATKIANAYDQMKDDPNAPDVKASYDAMIKETLAQYQAIKATGLKMEPIDYAKQGDPYAASPRLAAQDVIENNHLWFFPTSSGFGSDEKFDASKNPLLGDSGERIGDHVMLNNDVFRVVHDYFGHIKEGNGFRADGEDNAWRSHSAMYSDLAKGAMTSETRGQNSWVNFGPYGESNRTASGATTHYADQKVGLMPSWTWDGSLGKLAKYSEDEPRDDHGKWTTGGDSGDFKHDGKQWTGGSAKDNARLNKLKVPPAWKKVRLNPDPNGDKQAMGVDKKGRTQAIYSAAFRAGQDAAKFERLKDFNKVVPKAVEQIRSDMNNAKLDAQTRDSAAATYLISQTGIRIGSTKETGAEKQAYGASTLEGRHVKVNGDWISLNFTGKKGVDQKIRFQDADLAKYIADKGAKRSTPVFGDTSDAHIRDYFHNTVGDEFVVKDFRTWTGTATALRAIAGFDPPKTETDYKKAVRSVAKTVSEKLGNTPTIALKSYIDPTVFKSWSKDFKVAA